MLRVGIRKNVIRGVEIDLFAGNCSMSGEMIKCSISVQAYPGVVCIGLSAEMMRHRRSVSFFVVFIAFQVKTVDKYLTKGRSGDTLRAWNDF